MPTICRFLRLWLAPLLVCTVAGAAGAQNAVPAQRNWAGLRSKNFYVIGNSSEKDLRRVAARLEQFRETIGTLFPRAILSSSRPTVVLVFRTQRAFDPFKPKYEGKAKSISGLFLRGQAINTIALSTEGAEDYGIIYHEYMHQVVDNTVTDVPVWFNEGLAEYYSTFEVTPDGKQASLGRVRSDHILFLREQWAPLATVLAVKHDSPLYNERDKMSVFYAESWALAHYLLLGHQQKYAPHAAGFLAAISHGTPVEQATREVLGLDLPALERELRAYVRDEIFTRQVVTLPSAVSAVESLAVHPVPEADVHAALGELLVDMQRPDEARAELGASLALDASHAAAHATLGRLLLASNKPADAREHLAKAVAGPDASWYTHFDLAMLQMQARGTDAAVPESTIEASLRRVIELNPTFADGYGQLAWLMSDESSRQAEALALVRRARELAPNHEFYALLHATLLANTHDFANALSLARNVAQVASTPSVRSQAADLANRLEAYESARASAARTAAERASGPAQEAPAEAASPNPNASEIPRGIIPLLREVQPGEQRVSGWLTRIDCAASGITVIARVNGQPMGFHAARFEDVEFITYRDDLRGQVTCGARAPEDVVVLTFKPAAAGYPTVVAVEFPPKTYVPR